MNNMSALSTHIQTTYPRLSRALFTVTRGIGLGFRMGGSITSVVANTTYVGILVARVGLRVAGLFVRAFRQIIEVHMREGEQVFQHPNGIMIQNQAMALWREGGGFVREVRETWPVFLEWLRQVWGQ
jgi:hypothetical protein